MSDKKTAKQVGKDCRHLANELRTFHYEIHRDNQEYLRAFRNMVGVEL